MQVTNSITSKLARPLFGSCLLLLAGSNALAQAEVSPTASIGGYEAKFVDVNGIRTRYYEEGEGEPMILLHGAPWGGVASANTWVDNIATLSKHFHVYVPDRIGAGMTDNPKTDDDYNEIAMFEHMRDFITTLGLQPVHVVAHSLGGLSLYMAVETPELVKTMVLVASTHASPSVGTSRRLTVLKTCSTDEDGVDWYAEWRCRYEALSYDPSHVTDEFAESIKYMNERPKAVEARRKLATGVGGPLHANFYEWRRTMHKRIMDEGMLQMPIMIYWGRNDPMQPLQRAMALYDVLAEKNPYVQLTMTNKAGHFSYRERPEVFNQVVINWIESWRQMGVIGDSKRD
jgi:2-hydroxy-6-oxonona-2,4-dienedioate hydrolase